LSKGTEHVGLDLYFKASDDVSFKAKGAATVHLTGYWEPSHEVGDDELGIEGLGMDMPVEEEDEEDSDEETAAAIKQAQENARRNSTTPQVESDSESSEDEEALLKKLEEKKREQQTKDGKK
jgi:hypothetical protein